MNATGHNESHERWGDLRGPEAVTARLRAIEARIEQIRAELREVGRWADHPASPDVRGQVKRALELLADIARQVRQARERRLHR